MRDGKTIHRSRDYSCQKVRCLRSDFRRSGAGPRICGVSRHVQVGRRDRSSGLLPLDAIDVAVSEAPRPTVFLGVGFETTIPTVAATLKTALGKGIDNLFVLPAFKTIHPPLRILAAKEFFMAFCCLDTFPQSWALIAMHIWRTNSTRQGLFAGFEPLTSCLPSEIWSE